MKHPTCPNCVHIYTSEADREALFFCPKDSWHTWCSGTDHFNFSPRIAAVIRRNGAWMPVNSHALYECLLGADRTYLEKVLGPCVRLGLMSKTLADGYTVR
jgi:hypothetical protein